MEKTPRQRVKTRAKGNIHHTGTMRRLQSNPLSTIPATPTPTTSDSPSTVSSAAVAPATSGIAEYSCSNGTYLFSAQPAGIPYIQHCNTMYSYNSPSIFSVPDGLIEGLDRSLKYSFQDCVDSCDEWNNDNPDADAPCLSVSYYADLTTVFEKTDW